MASQTMKAAESPKTTFNDDDDADDDDGDDGEDGEDDQSADEDDYDDKNANLKRYFLQSPTHSAKCFTLVVVELRRERIVFIQHFFGGNLSFMFWYCPRSIEACVCGQHE